MRQQLSVWQAALFDPLQPSDPLLLHDSDLILLPERRSQDCCSLVAAGVCLTVCVALPRLLLQSLDLKATVSRCHLVSQIFKGDTEQQVRSSHWLEPLVKHSEPVSTSTTLASQQ